MANTMYKRSGLVQRKKTLTREQFEAHWPGTHANLCTKLPGMRRYSMNLIEAGRFPHFPYDGFSDLCCDSEADLKAALERAEGRTLLAGLPNLVEKIDPLVVPDLNAGLGRTFLSISRHGHSRTGLYRRNR